MGCEDKEENKTSSRNDDDDDDETSRDFIAKHFPMVKSNSLISISNKRILVSDKLLFKVALPTSLIDSKANVCL